MGCTVSVPSVAGIRSFAMVCHVLRCSAWNGANLLDTKQMGSACAAAPGPGCQRHPGECAGVAHEEVWGLKKCQYLNAAS